jgi:organic hydroperoxide reductase OsmC/OhrA
MNSRTHQYELHLCWTGNRGEGTRGYRAYGRDHEWRAAGKPTILGSSDPAFRGDAGRHNPEELLVAALSSCHMLWYLHLCSEAGISVEAYEDDPVGLMQEIPDGAGQFRRVTLRPAVTYADGSDEEGAKQLHHVAHEKCFIARSVNFEVACEPRSLGIWPRPGPG